MSTFSPKRLIFVTNTSPASPWPFFIFPMESGAKVDSWFSAPFTAATTGLWTSSNDFKRRGLSCAKDDSPWGTLHPKGPPLALFSSTTLHAHHSSDSHSPLTHSWKARVMCQNGPCLWTVMFNFAMMPHASWPEWWAMPILFTHLGLELGLLCREEYRITLLDLLVKWIPRIPTSMNKVNLTLASINLLI